MVSDAAGWPTTITVRGEGRVEASPDTASLSIGVQAMAATAGAALNNAKTSATALIAALRAADIDNRDIATSGVSISARYDREGVTVVGYQAYNNLTVTVRDVDRTGDVIDVAAQAAGDNITIGGVNFLIDDTAALLAEARAAAIADAARRAAQFAAAADATVGDVLQISEASFDGPSPRGFGGVAFAAKAMASTPVQAGTQEVAVSVTVVYQLRPSK